MLHRFSTDIDWSVLIVLAAFGFTCWLWGWHAAIRSGAQMYDEGYRQGYNDRRAQGTREPASLRE